MLFTSLRCSAAALFCRHSPVGSCTLPLPQHLPDPETASRPSASEEDGSTRSFTTCEQQREGPPRTRRANPPPLRPKPPPPHGIPCHAVPRRAHLQCMAGAAGEQEVVPTGGRMQRAHVVHRPLVQRGQARLHRCASWVGVRPGVDGNGQGSAPGPHASSPCNTCEWAAPACPTGCTCQTQPVFPIQSREDPARAPPPPPPPPPPRAVVYCWAHIREAGAAC